MARMNKDVSRGSLHFVSPFCLWMLQMAPEGAVTPSPGHIASLSLQRLNLSGYTEGNACVSTRLQRQELRRGIRPGVGDKLWAMKQPSLLCKDPSPHQPLSELEHS